MSSGAHVPGSDGLDEPGAADAPPSHAYVGGISSKPAQAGLSRTELAKARLEEKRLRLAQQRARMAASKASMAGASSLLRTASNASRAGSDTPSVTSPVAPMSGRTGGTTALQPSRSTTSTSSTPGSGGLTEALRSPRHRSAAIDVPTSPAQHLRRKISEQQHDVHPQLPRPDLRPGAARIAGAVELPMADVNLKGASGWVGQGLQQETAMKLESRPEGIGSRGLVGAVRSVAAQTAAPERSVSQTSTPRRKVEQSPRNQNAAPFTGLPNAQAASASGAPVDTDKLAVSKADASATSDVVPAIVADAGRQSDKSVAGTTQLGDSGSDPVADKMGFGSLSLASEPQAYPHQTPRVQVQPPKLSMPPPQPSRATQEIPLQEGTPSDAQEPSAMVATTSVVPAPMAEQQLSPTPAVKATTAHASNVGPAEVLQQPQSEAASMSPKGALPVNHDNSLTKVPEAPAAQEREAMPFFTTGGIQQLGAGHTLFPDNTGGADEDSFWLDQDQGPDQAWSGAGISSDSAQEQAAKGLAAHAALLGRDSPADTAPPSEPAQSARQVPAPAAPPAQQSATAMPETLVDAEKDEPQAGGNFMDAQTPVSISNPLAAISVPAVPPAVSSIPFAADPAPAHPFSCGVDPFEDAGGDDASFFDQLDSAAGVAPETNASSAGITEAPPVVFPAVSQHGHHEQPTGLSQGQWPGHTQAVGTPGHSASDQFPAPEDDAADWYNNQGAASSAQEPQAQPSTASQGYESAKQQQPQAQPAWNLTSTEKQGQPGGFNQPSTAADAYASGGQNYYAAGWQAVQVARPQTAGSARAPSFVPELWGARQGEPSSTAHAQLTPADGQAGPPPPAFGQQQPQSAQTYFAQPPRASAPSFLPAAPPGSDQQQPGQAQLASSQWPAFGQQRQQQQYPVQPAPPPFLPQAQPSFGGAQQWQGPQAQQWGHSSGVQDPAQYHTEGSSLQQQWQQSGASAGQAHAGWEQTSGQLTHAPDGAGAVSYYPDPPEPLEANGSEHQAYNGGVEGAGQLQAGWQGPGQIDYPSQTAPAAAAGWSGTVAGSAASTNFLASSGYGAQPQAAAAPGLDDVSETDFWGLQGDGDQDDPFTLAAPSTAATLAQNAAHGSMSQQPLRAAEQGQDSGAANEATSMSVTASLAPQEAAEETGPGSLSAEHGQNEAIRGESLPAPVLGQYLEQQPPTWSGQEVQEGHAQSSAPQQEVPPIHSLPNASKSGQHPEAADSNQGVQLESYQQADWNASEWRQQQADATLYDQPQQQYQPIDESQWQDQQQQPSATGFEEYHGASYSQQQQPGYDESAAPAEQYHHASYGFSSEQNQQQQQPGYNDSAAPAMPGAEYGARASVPFTPSPRTPSFHQPPAAVWGSQVRHQSAADAGLVPGSAAEGTRVTHGRPPCPVIAWGFGGRCVVMRPKMQGSAFSAGPVSLDMRWQPGPLQLMRMGTLAADLARLQTQAQWMQVGVMDDAQWRLQAFPGPLTPSVPRDKVVAFIAGVAAKEEALDKTSVTAAIWHVLRLLALNGGTLRSHSKSGKTKEGSPEAQLAKVLVPEAGSVVATNGWGAQNPSMRSPMHAPSHDPAAAAAMQALLISGRKAEALSVATDGQLWGPALLLARTCGERAFSETAAAAAAAAAAPGTPLSSLLHMLAGRPDLVLPAPGGPGASPGPAGQAGGKSGPSSGSFGLKALLGGAAPQQAETSTPEAEVGPSAAEVAMLTQWRENLAILAANAASPADEALIVRLGDRLWQQRGQEDAAHLCYVVAGVTPQSYDPSARLCLVGADHRAAPRSLACIPALQRTEILEWAKLPGAAQPAALTLPMLPYKVVYAARLAEAGLIAPALHYVGLVQAALSSFGAKIPPGLLVCRAMVTELEERLRTHATMFNLSVKHSQSSSFISGLGRFLDRGINKLITGGDMPPSGPPSTGSDGDPFGLHRRPTSDSGSPQHRRTSSFHALTPSGSSKDLGGSGQLHAASAAPNQAGSASPGPRPPRPPPGSAFAGASQPDQATAPAERSADLGGSAIGSALGSASSLRSMLGKGLGGLLGTAAPTSSKEAKLGEENKFFYDKERGMWREQGAAAPEPAAPLAPPPVIRQLPEGTPPGTAPPSGPSHLGAQPPARRTGAGARYVNTMNTTSRATNGGSASLPPLIPAPVPQAARPSFFVPAAPREPATHTPVFGQPGSSNGPSGSPSPARIDAQQSPEERPQHPSAHSGANGAESAFSSAGNGGSWPGPPQRQGMGGRVGSFSQYLSPPVSNGTSQGPPSPPHPPTASRLGPQPSSGPFGEQSEIAGVTQPAAYSSDLQYKQTDQVAGSDYYTSYSEVLGTDTTQQTVVANDRATARGWAAQYPPSHGQMSWAAQHPEAPGQPPAVAAWPGAADEMTELEL
ncbi:g7104 [Coccomyxa elongata]